MSPMPPPDGYTLGLINTSFTLLRRASMPAQNFDPSRISRRSRCSALHRSFLQPIRALPAHTVQELIALAKAEPGKHTFAEAGPATLANLAGVLFNKMANVQITAGRLIAAPSRKCRI